MGVHGNTKVRNTVRAVVAGRRRPPITEAARQFLSTGTRRTRAVSIANASATAAPKRNGRSIGQPISESAALVRAPRP